MNDVLLPQKKKPARVFPCRWAFGIGIGFCLLLAGLSLALGVFMWERFHPMEQTFEARLQQLQESIATRDKEWEDRQSAMQASENHITQLIQDAQKTTASEQRISEVHYLIRLADISLMMGDIPRAIALLKKANERWEGQADEASNALQQALTEDITHLSAISPVPVSDLLSQLDQLIAEVGGWVWKMPDGVPGATPKTENAAPVSQSGWEHFKNNIGALKNLFVIRHWDQPVAPFVQPESFEFLKQNIQMKLYQAEWALLNREPAVYQSSLKTVVQWLNTYANVPVAVAPVLKKIQELQDINIHPEPSPLQSLQLLPHSSVPSAPPASSVSSETMSPVPVSDQSSKPAAEKVAP